MAKITIDVKDKTKDKVMLAVGKAGTTLKAYLLLKLGVSDE